MSKSKTRPHVSSDETARGTPDARQKQEDREQRGRNIRETVESIAIAFILAFLFRTFEAEAFVIPTGSMAPTLQGRHKDVQCPACGYGYQASASSEANDEETGQRAPVGREVVSCMCPMCRYEMSVDPRPPEDLLDDPEIRAGTRQPSYNGDRILVGKFVYQNSDPSRWDVVVFKYPGEAKMNYIKRLVGLPGEIVRIRHGDILVRPHDQPDAAPQIARKPPDKIWALSQVVDDNAYIPNRLAEAGWPWRWQVWPPTAPPKAGGWEMQAGPGPGKTAEQTFTCDGTSNETSWIRYQHFVPYPWHWKDVGEGPQPAIEPIGPQLITDFYAYNTNRERSRGDSLRGLGIHWVGDLIVECDVELSGSEGELLLDLVEGGRHFTCTVNVKTGRARLAIDDIPSFAPEADTPLRGPGQYRLAFANVDDQLLLWIDGDLVEFESPTIFESPDEVLPRSTPEDAGDLAPCGIGTRGAAATIRGLRVLRDIYYIADQTALGQPSVISDYDEGKVSIGTMSDGQIAATMSDPSRWGLFAHRKQVEFPLDADQFFVLGDNSPHSKDGRLWATGGEDLNHFVDRKLLIGKALFIYWPHSWDRIPGTRIWFPYFPNFSNMGFVR